ncbi:hypothetical protein [Dyella japonica]|uniref:Secreted protein n=1 Tax=Dyella japonica TaxID=231455 RepID=A0ABV2K1F1_9GAMM
MSFSPSPHSYTATSLPATTSLCFTALSISDCSLADGRCFGGVRNSFSANLAAASLDTARTTRKANLIANKEAFF